MITLQSELIFRSLIFAITFGILCGSVYSMLRSVFCLAESLVLKRDKKKNGTPERYGILLNLFDGCYVLIVGIIYIVFAYVLVDGVIEIYSAIMLLVGLLIGKRVSDRFFTI